MKALRALKTKTGWQIFTTDDVLVDDKEMVMKIIKCLKYKIIREDKNTIIAEK